ncbi:MAG: GNAT family N-acetyltransferase [Bacteroidota bacterium]|nr:GNAT family N-acetyltransferase [Bacteroidota bacterium]
MICVPVPTMIADVRECDFLKTWSGSTRTKINKVSEEKLIIHRGIDFLPEILKLFSKTASSKKLRGHMSEDFDSRPWIVCTAVYHDDKILAGHVWLIDEEEKRSLLFVNASAHQEDMSDTSLVGRAHYYLLYQDGLYLRSHGIDFLDLNGYDPDHKDPSLIGVNRWKEATHGQREDLYNYYPFWFHWYRKWRKV